MRTIRYLLPHTLLACVVALGAIGCLQIGIRSTTRLVEAPPYPGDPEVRLPADAPHSRPVLRMSVGLKGELFPSGELLEEIKREGAAAGAAVVVIDCGRPGTVGQYLCEVTGYAPQP